MKGRMREHRGNIKGRRREWVFKGKGRPFAGNGSVGGRMGYGESTAEGRRKREEPGNKREEPGKREREKNQGRERAFTMGKGGGQIKECERDPETPVEEPFNFSLSLTSLLSFSSPLFD